jgi:coiled-coil domain-containing protein 77
MNALLYVPVRLAPSIDAFDRERVDFLQRLDELSGNSREKHSLKWEVHKKDEQLMDLQKALSDAHVFLYEERAQVLKLTAENDRLKSKRRSDRGRICRTKCASLMCE